MAFKAQGEPAQLRHRADSVAAQSVEAMALSGLLVFSEYDNLIDVVVTLRDGEPPRAVQHALGSLDQPLDDDQVDDKVDDLLRDYRSVSAGQLRRAIQALDQVANVRPMCQWLLGAR
jgi:hypothetical protein